MREHKRYSVGRFYISAFMNADQAGLSDCPQTEIELLLVMGGRHARSSTARMWTGAWPYTFPYTANLCQFLRLARNDARRLPMALLSHAEGPNARAPGWAAVVALDGHSRTEVRQFRSKKRICRVADSQNPHLQHWPVILPACAVSASGYVSGGPHIGRPRAAGEGGDRRDSCRRPELACRCKYARCRTGFTNRRRASAS